MITVSFILGLLAGYVIGTIIRFYLNPETTFQDIDEKYRKL